MRVSEFFFNTQVQEPDYFEEVEYKRTGTITFSAAKNNQYVNTSSINVSTSDAFKQGVEINSQKAYDAGWVKIYSGEPGHILKQTSFGMQNRSLPPGGTPFADKSLLSPTLLINAAPIILPNSQGSLLEIIVVGDNDCINVNSLDGIIEPFAIRAKLENSNLEFPFPAHEVFGSVMDGNLDFRHACDQVKTVDEFEPRLSNAIFDDSNTANDINLWNGKSSLNATVTQQSTRPPFFDVSRFEGEVLFFDYVAASTINSPDSGSIIVALEAMNGSSDNYVPPIKRAATSGYTYDFGGFPGTDSLAFGGMAY